MKKTFRNLLVAASCAALFGFAASCSGSSKASNDSSNDTTATAETEEVAVDVQQNPFAAAAQIVRDLPQKAEDMTEAQKQELQTKGNALCEAINGKPAEIEVAPALGIQVTNVKYENCKPYGNGIHVKYNGDCDKKGVMILVLYLDKDDVIVYKATGKTSNRTKLGVYVTPFLAPEMANVAKIVIVPLELNSLMKGDVYKP